MPRPLELTAVGETVVMDNVEVFRLNGFNFQFDIVRILATSMLAGWLAGCLSAWPFVCLVVLAVYVFYVLCLCHVCVSRSAIQIPASQSIIQSVGMPANQPVSLLA